MSELLTLDELYSLIGQQLAQGRGSLPVLLNDGDDNIYVAHGLSVDQLTFITISETEVDLDEAFECLSLMESGHLGLEDLMSGEHESHMQIAVWGILEQYIDRDGLTAEGRHWLKDEREGR